MLVVDEGHRMQWFSFVFLRVYLFDSRRAQAGGGADGEGEAGSIQDPEI